MTIIPVSNVVITNNSIFINNQNITSVDLSYAEWINNSMYNAFYNCQKLSSVTNINENVTDMFQTFSSCWNLVNAPIIPNSVTNMSYTFSYCTKLVNAPIIPNSVTNMFQTFFSCWNLVNAPEIPNSVTDMFLTFSSCWNLVNAPIIPNSVTSMGSTFSSCSNLVNAPIIPNSVTNMSYTFRYCTNLANDIEIYSEDITSAQNCFEGTSLDKNVYIPFQNNGVNTLTYNSFINAGYSTDTRVDGVLLMDLNNLQTPLYYCYVYPAARFYYYTNVLITTTGDVPYRYTLGMIKANNSSEFVRQGSGDSLSVVSVSEDYSIINVSGYEGVISAVGPLYYHPEDDLYS